MRAILIIIYISQIFVFNSENNISNFDSNLSDIVQEFKEAIMSKEECENVMSDINYLIEEIDSAIEMEDTYTYDEIYQLKKLKKEAEAIEQFMGSVASCGNYFISIEDFNLANNRINASVNYVIKDKYCINVIVVKIDDYVCYLGENYSNHNYTVSYKWKALNNEYLGNGTMGLPKHSIRHIYDNRENPNIKDIYVYKINCKKF